MYAGGLVSYRGVQRRRGARSWSSPTTASTPTSTSTTAGTRRSRPTPSPWWATAPPSASSTSTSSRRPTTAPTCTTARRSRWPTRAPRCRPRSCSPTSPHTVESVEPGSRCARPSTSSVTAFAGTGQDLQRIIDTGTSFIHEANRNFDVTTALIRDSNTVLHGQIASADAIRSFARDLQAVLGHAGRPRPRPAPGDRQRRRSPPPSCGRFLDDNKVDLGQPDQQPGHHRRHRGQAPPRPPPGARALPLRRRGRLHGGVEVARDRAVRRALRHGR